MASTHDEPSTQAGEPALDSPQNSFHYTNIFYITRRSMWHSEIRIYDITSSTTAPYQSEDFKAAVLNEGQARADSAPEWIILNYGFRKTASLHTGGTTVSTMGDENLVAKWEPSKAQHGKNKFIFPAESTHSGHTIVMEREKKWAAYDEVFVVDSIPYFWRYDGHLRRKFMLWKVVGQNKRVVARYKRNNWGTKRGGVLAVNAEEVDSILAAMTIMAMLRKARQRG